MSYIDPVFKKYAERKYSRFGEYGLVKYLTSTIELTTQFTNKNPYLVEIGVHPSEGNTVGLIQDQDWDGLWIDVRPKPVPEDDLKRFPIIGEWVKQDNINFLFTKYKVPWDFDLLSIDIDGNDYWIWKALLYKPRIVVIEYNAHLWKSESKVIPYWDSFNWRGDRYYGASLMALTKLGIEKGYTLVASYCHNAFFVRDDLIDNKDNFDYQDIYEYFPIHPFVTEHSMAKENQKWVEV